MVGVCGSYRSRDELSIQDGGPVPIYLIVLTPEVGKYENLAKVGQGTFGEVFKARDRKNGRLVALKKVCMENEKEGFPMTALREIQILQLLKYDNIVNLVEICRSKGGGKAQASASSAI